MWVHGSQWPFGTCLINSRGNPAHFHTIWAEFAALFIRQIPNSSHDKKTKYKREKRILAALFDLPANQHSQFSHIWVELGGIGCADYLVDQKWPPRIFYSLLYFNFCLFKKKSKHQFFMLNISMTSDDGVKTRNES